MLLGRALVTHPDLLLLDEPTNHLDLEAITWLESYLVKLDCALLFITHDRAFLQKIATRIVELDRGHLQPYDCDYQTYLKRKEVLEEAEAKQDAEFDKKLAQEEAWLRRGIKARRTRNEGRVRALMKMRIERARRRETQGGPSFAAQQGETSGHKVIDCDNAGHAYDGTGWQFRGLTTTLMRGDKVGIIGPNGSGKTTLLRVLLGQLPPTEGTVAHGTKLEIAYFDQHRATLDPSKTVKYNLAGENEFVMVNGAKRPVYGYLQDFLFAPDRARSPVRQLSGGERNRLLLARLFTRPCNLLVLDEPTNDLDIETLELLETILVDYQATLLLVSHDREFLNRVVTSTLALEPGGRIRETVGGYDDYQRALNSERERLASQPQAKRAAAAVAATSPAAPRKSGKVNDRPRYRSQKEQRELDALPAHIEALEMRQADIAHCLGQPNLGQPGGPDPKALTAELADIETALANHYERWEALEALPVKE